MPSIVNVNGEVQSMKPKTWRLPSLRCSHGVLRYFLRVSISFFPLLALAMFSALLTSPSFSPLLVSFSFYPLLKISHTICIPLFFSSFLVLSPNPFHLVSSTISYPLLPSFSGPFLFCLLSSRPNSLLPSSLSSQSLPLLYKAQPQRPAQRGVRRTYLLKNTIFKKDMVCMCTSIIRVLFRFLLR